MLLTKYVANTRIWVLGAKTRPLRGKMLLSAEQCAATDKPSKECGNWVLSNKLQTFPPETQLQNNTDIQASWQLVRKADTQRCNIIDCIMKLDASWLCYECNHLEPPLYIYSAVLLATLWSHGRDNINGPIIINGSNSNQGYDVEQERNYINMVVSCSYSVIEPVTESNMNWEKDTDLE
jgi:hypothetical protein